MSPSIIKVILADDHAILRDGLKQILSETDDIQVIAEAESATEAIMIARKNPADVVVLDISLPDRNGVEALKTLKKENPNLAVLMLSMHKEDQYAIRSLKAGASGYLTKQGASSELVTAIRTVAKGKKYLTASVAESLANHLGDEEKPLHQTLSDREFQTLTMIASGMTVGEIAEKLCLSVKTISVYRARLLEKMRLHNNSEITHYAIKNHLIDSQ
ncbi:MAG: DNA-binding response regulator [Betaproteobacteria bacterium HGW-Betaproteobacteria-1]|jgi:DNA-binding NarL/FixJ family response regulator|nr:MAG: DNA-binding response regulator [Betaproteobacteria bacterium HGW-Betaproteobacteria-1]